MQKIEEYIAKRKKKDKLDEFDFNKHSENMGTIIQYVMDYFNEYLNIEDYSYEQVKTQQIIDKFKSGIGERYPESQDFIIDYYWRNKKRLDTLVGKAYEELEDCELFYLPEDDRCVAEYVCTKKLNLDISEDLIEKMMLISKEHRINCTTPPSNSEMKDLDNKIVDWVKKAFRDFSVDIFQFAQNIAYEYYQNYVQTIYDSSSKSFYHINKYEYRYQENPFDIDAVYERNKHREFINGYKGELEMMIMYNWLRHEVYDMDYWPEYVNLCIMNHRVTLLKYKRILLPVKPKSLEYPCDIQSYYNYIETQDGVLKQDPGEEYVLHITYLKNDDIIWKNSDETQRIVKNLQESFKKYRAPKLIEFTSPFQSTYFTEEDFYTKYRIFENGLKRYNKMKIAIVNGYLKRSGGKEYLFSSIDDIIRLRKACREMKFKLKLALDFTDVNGKNTLKKELSNTINTLAEMRPFIIAVHLNSIRDWHGYRTIYKDDKNHNYYGTYEEWALSDFLSGLGMILQDNRKRFLIPNGVKSSDKLEELVDMLLRAGCYIDSGEREDEKEF